MENQSRHCLWHQSKSSLLPAQSESSLPSLISTQSNPTPPPKAFLFQQNKAVLWHNRLGHPTPRVVRQVLQSCNLNFSCSEHFCSVCQVAKSHRLPFLLSESRAVKPFDLVYYDLWGPAPIASMVLNIFSCLLMTIPGSLGFTY